MSRAFAFKSLAQHFERSTSGGAFFSIVEQFFTSGGQAVYGAVMDEHMTVRHIRATNLETCRSFQKSKYVKSNLSRVFQMVEGDLCQGLKVLFSGTPCQVFSLIGVLKKKGIILDNLFTIDLICNGAPNPTVWSDYVSWLEGITKKKLVYFGFREKGDQTNPYLTKAVFSDGSFLLDSSLTAAYNRLFLKKLIIPKQCFNCMFKKEERYSDITLADFWGINRIFSDFPSSGVSLVLVNTSKGENLFCNIYDSNMIVKEVHSREYIKYQNNLRGDGAKIPQNYNRFWEDYQKRGIGFVLYKYGDSTFPRSILHPFRKLYRNIRIILQGNDK